MLHNISVLLITFALVQVLVAAPVDPKKETKSEKKDGKGENEETDDFGLEYGRYLQQVVQALEEDKEFAKKLENISSDEIKTGKIAHQLEFVKHNVRTKLDELKRMEVDRLRKLVQEQMERTELGLYRDEEGRLLPSPDGRRWRTIAGRPGLDRRGVKIAQHLDVENLHSFEISDLKKLIKSATKDLEELDRQRREEFKKYELEKEAKYRESLKNMTEDQKKETEKHHEELVQKHKDHPKVHHPGSKPQLEQVWEEEDHMAKEDFNPRTFFAMHDINEDGHLDESEVEAVLRPEVKKMYNPENEEDDPAEMEEEYHRMREHIFNETDRNNDGLISLEEFLKMTEQQAFEQDEGWKGLDEQNVYSEAELEEYMRQRQMNQQYYGGDPRAYYDVPHAQGLPPNINYPGGQPGQPQYHQPAYPQQPYQGMPPHQQQQQQYQGVPPHQQQQYQGVPQQQYQGMPPQHQGIPPQHQGIPPQQQQGMPQQQHQGMPQQQHQGMPQQQHQGIPQQQGMPSQQQHQGMPPQQQYQGVPPQHQPQFQAPQVRPNPPQQQPPSPSVAKQDPIDKTRSDLPSINAIPQQLPKN